MCAVRRSVSVMLAIAVLSTTWSMAGPLPSKSEPPAASTASRSSDLGTVHRFLARNDVRGVLQSHGLSDADVEQRLAQLSDEDLQYLADNLSQVRAAGAVPDYIWVLLAVFLGVLILGAIF